MLVLVILIAWLSVSGLAVAVCIAASRADDMREVQTREKQGVIQSPFASGVSGDDGRVLVASRSARWAASARS